MSKAGVQSMIDMCIREPELIAKFRADLEGTIKSKNIDLTAEEREAARSLLASHKDNQSLLGYLKTPRSPGAPAPTAVAFIKPS